MKKLCLDNLMVLRTKAFLSPARYRETRFFTCSVSGQPWACHGALQGQMQSLLCAAVLVGPALGPAAGPCRLFVGGAVLPVSGEFVEEEAALSNHSAQSPARV